jgi:hypothetical protein
MFFFLSEDPLDTSEFSLEFEPLIHIPLQEHKH